LGLNFAWQYFAGLHAAPGQRDAAKTLIILSGKFFLTAAAENHSAAFLL
jgi:hypothetical protein